MAVALASPVALPHDESPYSDEVGMANDEAETDTPQDYDAGTTEQDSDVEYADPYPVPDDDYTTEDAASVPAEEDEAPVSYGSPEQDDASVPPEADAEPAYDDTTAQDSAGMPPATDAPPAYDGATGQNSPPANNGTAAPADSAMPKCKPGMGAPPTDDSGAAPYPDTAASPAGYGDGNGGSKNNTTVDTEQGIEPATCEPYVVQEGDTCAKIAEMYDFPVEDLLSNNEDIDEDCTNLVVGEELCVTPPVIVEGDDYEAEADSEETPAEEYDAPAEADSEEMPVEEYDTPAEADSEEMPAEEYDAPAEDDSEKVPEEEYDAATDPEPEEEVAYEPYV